MLPTLRSVVLDTTDARGLAEFYRQLLGYEYRPGDEPQVLESQTPQDGTGSFSLIPPGRRGSPSNTSSSSRRPHGQTMACLSSCTSTSAFQLRNSSSPRASVLSHSEPVCCKTASTIRSEPLYVYADPAGHPFCIFVAPPT
jgi:hypothetical protein